MSKSALVIFGAVLFGCVIYVLSPGPGHFIAAPTSWELREQLVFLTGVCALSLMVASMLISARFSWVSRLLNGLDKGYVVHKWTGIVSTIAVMAHFLLEKAPEWLVEAGFVADPGELTDAGHFAEWQINLFQSGMLAIQPVFYAMLVLVVIALFRKIPYHWFRQSHRVFPVVFLLAAWHGATAQLKEHWLGSPGSFLLLGLTAAGSAAAIRSLAQKNGASRKVRTTISSLSVHPGGILDLRLTVNGKPFHCEPGQYAFLKFAHDNEPHPFSVASSDKNGATLRFIIKALGDFTARLPDQLRAGQTVEVEGPYGEFLFHDECERQVWIAGGIGITPFMAQLEYLAGAGNKQPVDFWYATRGDQSTAFPVALEASCRTGGVHLHHVDTSAKEYVTAALIRNTIGDLSGASIWFCGPADFAQCIMQELRTSGFDLRHFHYDSFSMR